MKNLLFFCLLFMSITTFGQLKIPKGYVVLKESPSNGQKMKTLVFKFDDDHHDDYATIVQHTTEFANYKLLIYLSATKQQQQIDLVAGNEFNIYPTALKLQNNVLQFGYFLDGTSAFGRFIKLRYHASSKKIQIIGYDTGYRSSADSHIDKTFNLLTGKFIVRKQQYPNGSEEKAAVKEYTGSAGGYRSIFATNLNAKLLERLDAIGKMYE